MSQISVYLATIEVRNKLTIKELSPVLGRSVSFLYKARMVGLPMHWDENSRCYVQTPEKVRRWLRLSHFKVVDGRPFAVEVKKK